MDTSIFFYTTETNSFNNLPVVGLSKVCDSACFFYKIFDMTSDCKKSEQWDFLESSDDFENVGTLTTFVGNLIPLHHYVIIPYILRYCKKDLIGVNKGDPFRTTTISSKENDKRFSVHD